MGLDIVEFVMEVEETFAIRISDREAEKILTPRMLINYVYSHAVHPGKVMCLSQRAFYAVRRELCARLALPRRSLRPKTDLLTVLPQQNAEHLWGEVGAALRCQPWPSIRGDGWFARHFQKSRPRTLGEAAKYVATYTPGILKRSGEGRSWDEVRRMIDRLIREHFAIHEYSLDDNFHEITG